MALVAFAVTGLGILVAWRMESVQGFHALMNLVLMPMLILSGAFFPPSGSAGWMRTLISLNPMTYGVTLIRSSLYLRTAAAGAADSSVWKALAVTVVLAAGTFVLAIREA